MQGFNGFPAGKQPLISVPAQFFSELLPQIDHLIEMKVTLYCFWALQSQAGPYQYVRLSEVCRDELFLQGIPARPDERWASIQDGFERAVVRGSLLHLPLELNSGEVEDFYFVNTARGREAVAKIQQGEWMPESALRSLALHRVRPSIFAIYERSIGALTPMVAEQIQDAVDSYSEQAVRNAIQKAVEKDIRRWAYISAILENQHKREAATLEPSAAEQLAEIETQYADLMWKDNDD